MPARSRPRSKPPMPVNRDPNFTRPPLTSTAVRRSLVPVVRRWCRYGRERLRDQTTANVASARTYLVSRRERHRRRSSSPCLGRCDTSRSSVGSWRMPSSAFPGIGPGAIVVAMLSRMTNLSAATDWNLPPAVSTRLGVRRGCRGASVWTARIRVAIPGAVRFAHRATIPPHLVSYASRISRQVAQSSSPTGWSSGNFSPQPAQDHGS